MTGDNGSWYVLASVQPGGRPPAPGELALVQSFINSHYDLAVNHGADLFATPGALRDWLLARDLIDARARVGERELARALAVREGLRELARALAVREELRKLARCSDQSDAVEQALAQLNRAAGGAGVEVRFARGGPRFVLQAGGGVSAALGLVMAFAGRAMIDGSFSRLKICPGEDCGWAFYDHSRNQTGRWCSMSVCGGRAKARTHYRRLRRGGG